jgi:hypothetical protein
VVGGVEGSNHGEVTEKRLNFLMRVGGDGLDEKEVERGECVSAGGGGVVHYLGSYICTLGIYCSLFLSFSLLPSFISSLSLEEAYGCLSLSLYTTLSHRTSHLVAHMNERD